MLTTLVAPAYLLLTCAQVGDASVLVSDAARLTMDPSATRGSFVHDSRVWALKFLSDDAFAAFEARWSDCLFENHTGLEATEANKAKHYGEYASWAAGEDADDVEPMQWSAPEDEAPKKTPSKFRRSLATAPANVAAAAAADDAVTELQMGALRNSYLLRGDTISVFRNTDEGLEDETTILRLRDASGKAFTPQKALLARGEADLMLLTPDASASGATGRGSHSVMQYDIERQTVVTRWQCEKDTVAIPMMDIVGDTKAAQLEAARSTFLGLDGNRLARWDVRARQGAVQDLSSPVLGRSGALEYVGGHDFARGTGFTCMATTGSGDVAVGSFDGRIRLYSDSTLRQAKTTFPGLGAPITHIDVTWDGKYVLATTATYLMLISTQYKDVKKDALTTGFKGRAGGALTAPRLLRLLPHDVAGSGSAPFSRGRFTWVTDPDDATTGGAERYITAVCGPYSIVWSFRAVLAATAPGAGKPHSSYDYSLVGTTQQVADAGQMHGKFTAKTPGKAALVMASQRGDVTAFIGEEEEE